MSSSPFELFRRNLKPMMVALTLLALFSFVILPSVAMYQQQKIGYGAAESKLATYKEGDFDFTKVNYFTRNHFATTQFLRELAETTIARGGAPKVADFQYNTQQKAIQALGINSNPSDQSSVRTLMFAGEAKKAGFDLDDTAIRNWLTLYSDGRLSDSEINGILAKSSRSQMGQVQLYEQLRMQLLAQAYQRQVMGGLTSGGMPIVPPAQQWELFLRLNRRAVADAYAVNIADFIEKTNAKPSEKLINEIYEEGKQVYPDDQSPKPAFRRPFTANIEYLAGNLNDFIDREVKTVTEEQLKTEYQKRLEGGDFKLPVKPAEKGLGDGEKGDGEKRDGENGDGENGDGENGDGENGDGENGDGEKPAATSPEVKMTEPNVETAPATETPADAAPKVEPPAVETPKVETEATPKPAGSSRLLNSGDGIRLVAMQADDVKPNEAKPDEPKADAPAAAEKPAEIAEVKPESKAEEKTAEPQVAPFEKVRDDIARALAQPEALKKLDAAVTEVDKTMRTYFNARAIAGKKEKTPTPPDLKALAEKLGMKHFVTGPMDGREIQDNPIAQSFGVGTAMQRGDGFVQTMFVTRPPVFTPVRTVDDQARVSYVAWKTEEKAEFVPELKDIREEVIVTIRNIEARKLAKAEAERLAKEFKATDKPIKELVPAERASMYTQSLGPFSWMNSLGFGMRAFMGNVPELDNVGEAFMRAVFTSDRGEWAVAPNMSETVYYVVRPTEFTPSTDELHQRFVQASQRMQTMSLAVEEAIKIRDGHYEALDRRTGFKWNEKAIEKE